MSFFTISHTKLRQRWVLGILLITLFISGGCWDRREFETLGIVAGFGMDLEEEEDKILLTAQIIKPTQVKAPQGSDGGGGGGGGGEAVWVTQSKGEGVFKAIRNFLFESSRKLYYPHNQIVVIGKKAAIRGVGPLLDVLIRDQEPRMSEWLLIAEDKAAEILQAQSELEKIPALSIRRSIENYIFTSEIPQVDLQEFISGVLGQTSVAYAPLIKAEGEGKEKKYRIFGTAVFFKDKYVGELNKEETRGLLWVRGEVQGGIITLDYRAGMEKVEIEVVDSSAKIIPEIKNGRVLITVKIREEGNLGANLTPVDFSIPEQLRDLNAKQATEIEGEIRAALKKAQALKTDIFGFGEAIYRKYPRKWKKVQKDWPDIFSSLKVKIEVNSDLHLIGITTRPISFETK